MKKVTIVTMQPHVVVVPGGGYPKLSYQDAAKLIETHVKDEEIPRMPKEFFDIGEERIKKALETTDTVTYEIKTYVIIQK